MSRLDELIKELCPDGVEYKKLEEIATISRGGNFQKKDYVESGVPCIHYGQIYTYYGLFAEETISYISEEKAAKQKFAKSGDIVMAVTSENIDDICKCLAWLGTEDIAVSGHSAIISHSLNPKFLVYYFHSSMFDKQKRKLAHGTKVLEVTPDHLLKLEIPVPPLEIQKEIVKTLDKFTDYVTELQAELQARKQQYEYYAEKLLINDGYPFEKLGDTCEMKAGKAIKASMLSNEIDDAHAFPCFGGNGIRGYINNASHEGDFPIIGRQGALCGNVQYATGKFYATEHAVVVQSKGKYDQRYLYYLLTSMNLNQYKSAGAQPGLAVKNIAGLIAPVPPIERQKRIADTLDRFDVLCTDISDGLPAEIEARQKQYEYYRDKLLSFKEIEL